MRQACCSTHQAKDEQDEQTLQVLEDTKQQFRLTSIETQGVDPAKETGTDGPTNVEEEIQKIKQELEEEEKEKTAMIGCLKEIRKINSWLSFI